jgi:23S rRNA pseudouridine2605 synthase
MMPMYPINLIWRRIHMPEERVQKILARSGLGSRRYCEKIIEQGRVVVNGEKIKLGSKADQNVDHITVNEIPINKPEAFVYIALYKPRGVLSTVTSEDNRRTVIELINSETRIYPVGRLDVDSEGLILLTNDGELTNQLTHPRYGHQKEYRVLVARHPDSDQLALWERGVILPDGYQTKPVKIRLDSHAGKGTWLRIIMMEGRKRQIRETGKLIGLPVAKIIRVRIGNLYLRNLIKGEYRNLTSDEVKSLKQRNQNAN